MNKAPNTSNSWGNSGDEQDESAQKTLAEWKFVVTGGQVKTFPAV